MPAYSEQERTKREPWIPLSWHQKLSRRNLLKGAVVGGAGLATAALIGCGREVPSKAEPQNPIPNPTITPTGTLESTLTSTPEPSPTPERQRDTLREYASRLGLDIGVEFTGNWFNNLKWRGIIEREFNLAVVDWGIHWPEIEPEQNHFNFAIADRQVIFARQNDMKIRGHPLVVPAPDLVPNWLKDGSFSRDQLIEILRNHISKIVTHFKGKIHEWVVVNEPYIYPYRQNDIFHRIIGPDYIEIAFQTARETNPSATLIYNDTLNHASSGITTPLTREVVQRLKAKGLIDGVGLQMHLDAVKPPQKEDVMATMRSYGVPVYVTEFDVNMKDIRGTQEERYAVQAQIYRDMLEAALDSGVCKSFTVWVIGDKYSWLEFYPNVPNYSPVADPTPFDDELNPKPAFFVMRQVLTEKVLSKG